MAKTVLDKLKDQIFNGGLISKDTIYSWIEKLKEEEKEQMIGFWDEAERTGNDKLFKNGHEYYEETFKS